MEAPPPPPAPASAAIAAPMLDDEPKFVDAYLHGPLDSIYNVEYQRLEELCRGQPEACWAQNLDSTAVPLARYWRGAGDDEPAGWLSARLRTQGRWPYAALVAQGDDAAAVTLIEDVGDWGYGMTVPIRQVQGDRFQPWFLAEMGVWLSLDGGRGFSVLEGPFGLTGRLWYFQHLEAAGAVGESSIVPAGVYMVLGVENGQVRFRAEIPQDMPCGEDVDSVPTVEVEILEVPVEALLDEAGRPRVDVAYGKGC
ncbi:MAG: hypothetical protein HKN72_05040 [Gemmatimonadetes bacterium]|nr:hypothetical protein [Gemmatimonadota bacterium]